MTVVRSPTPATVRPPVPPVGRQQRAMPRPLPAAPAKSSMFVRGSKACQYMRAEVQALPDRATGAAERCTWRLREGAICVQVKKRRQR